MLVAKSDPDATLTLPAWLALSRADKARAFETLCTGGRADLSYKAAQPSIPGCDWLPTLYCDVAFPTYRNATNNFCVTVLEDNVLDGYLDDAACGASVAWSGYASQLYDGQLRLCAQSPSAGVVGVAAGVAFEFRAARLVKGAWPGFLCMYEKPGDAAAGKARAVPKK